MARLVGAMAAGAPPRAAETFPSEEIIFAIYHTAGLRVFVLRDAHEPNEIEPFVASPPARMLDSRPGNALAPRTCDVNVPPDGAIYPPDWNSGPNVLRYEG